MNTPLLIVIVALLASPSALFCDEPKLVPNAKLTFEFPELPETFYTQSTGDKRPAMLTAQLPENYTREGRFPIFVFINGGNGGRGDSLTARSIAGPRDFIAVSLPLFKDKAPANAPQIPGFKLNPAQIILPGDGAILSRAYVPMLKKLCDTVPNIAKEHSVLGGFSNGAHAASALVADGDEFILSHFTAFCFYEGGIAVALNPAALHRPGLKGSRLIALFGDGGDIAGRKLAEPFLVELTAQASAAKLDFTRIVMRGHGHEMPPEYTKLLGNWIRGERLPEVK